MAILLTASVMHSFWIFVRRFGALMFFPLGLLDMSVFPAPGSFDALLIVLVASHKGLWWYYVLMATAGSVVGAWPTFRLGRRGGEETLEKRLGKNAKKVFDAFQKWGFWSMMVGALAPPPMPATAFVLTAGALDYPWHKFVLSWTLGRVLRFGIIAWITEQYGGAIFKWMRGYYKPALWALVILGIVGGFTALWFYVRERRRRAAQGQNEPQRRAA